MRWIIVTGLPATGKTTLARQLAARYRLPLLAKDVIKELLLDTGGTADTARSRRLSDMSFGMLFAQLKQLAGAGVDTLLEGNFRAGQHEASLRAAPAVHIAQVLCRCDEDQRLARIAARAADARRHPGHGDAQAARDASNDSFLDLAGERLLFDTGLFDSGAAATGHADLLQQLDRWWESSADESR